ncbi:MAG: hypothetical protein ACR2QM_18085 [Longimicrobiales bacterium]
MSYSHIGTGAALSLMAVLACGAERAEEASSGVEVAQPGVSGQEVRACDVLDLEAASRTIGPGTEHPGGDTEAGTCLYSNPGVAMLTLQIGPAELYDQVSIQQPHTSVRIGDRGRHNVQVTGVVAVQFVAGAYSATLGVQPMGEPDADYLEPLLSVARAVADRLP